MMPEAESTGSRSNEAGDVVAAVDEIDGSPHLVVANIARDDSWIAMSEADAVSLEECR
ncbi:DUF7556 family protein [Natrinema sp. LN54]|uniref:DUF7556 family protein n=1 Tax=Natrinema sp. LN54 TaxID=3458705 RepID=UPI004036D835